MNGMAIVWLLLMVAFLAIESSTVALVCLWFAFGALASLILSLLNVELWVQVVVFLAVSCALLAALRPLVKKYITPKLVKTNIDSVIGSAGLVTQTIDNVKAAGQVKLGAMFWTARSVSGQVIPEGTLIRVEHIEGVKVFVEPAEVPAEK